MNSDPNQMLRRLVGLRLLMNRPLTADDPPISLDSEGAAPDAPYNPWSSEDQLKQLVARRLLAGRPLSADDLPAPQSVQAPNWAGFSVASPAAENPPADLRLAANPPPQPTAGAPAGQIPSAAEPPVSRIGVDVATQTDAAGRQFIRDNENPTGPYRVPKDGLIGYSHKITPAEAGKYDQGITQADADALFARDAGQAEAAVRALVKVPVTQNMFNALVDFVYEAGRNSLANSEILKALNSGNYLWAESAIPATRAGTQGVYNRRLKEAQLFGTRWKE